MDQVKFNEDNTNEIIEDDILTTNIEIILKNHKF